MRYSCPSVCPSDPSGQPVLPMNCRITAVDRDKGLVTRAGRGSLALLVTAGLAACSAGSDTPPVEPTPTIATASLKQFSGDTACEQLEAEVEKTATTMMSEQLRQLRAYRFVNDAPMPVSDVVGAPSSNAGSGNDAAATAPGAPESSASRYSDTNVQVIGVDELDPVKNDGQSLFSLTTSGDSIVLTHAALQPASAMRVVGQSRWSMMQSPSGQRSSREQPVGLYQVDQSQLLAVTSSQNYSIMPFFDGPALVATDSICVPEGCGPYEPDWAPPRTTLRLFTTNAGQAPAENWQVSLPGRLIESRRIGQKVYVVSEANLEMPATVKWWPARTQIANDVQWQSAIDALIAQNTSAIALASLTDWLAPLREDAGGVAPGASECAAYATTGVPTRLAWLRVNTVDLAARTVSHQTVLATGSAVYMSANSLIVSTDYWEPVGQQGFTGQSVTYLHRFALNDSNEAQYRSSGHVTGRLINSYAIDEASDGTVRVAMTDRSQNQSYSYLATLTETDGKLKELGRTGNIAPGETLQSARFIGRRAYLVTFRQIDPFFVVDLTDAAAPTILGELKIPGFSSYLHPVGDNHILGIGYDGGGWPRRVKASLFNVTDPSQPSEQSVLLLGESFTDSSALWDPHAFTYYPSVSGSSAVMSVPVRSYQSTRYGTRSEAGIRLVAVDPAQGSRALALRGTLDMSDLLSIEQAPDGWRSADPRRSVFINDTVYGVSDSAIRAADLNDPAVVLGTLQIP